jgi:hypothetical protein
LCPNKQIKITVSSSTGYLPPAGSTDTYKLVLYYIDALNRQKILQSGYYNLSVFLNTMTLLYTPQGSYTVALYDKNNISVGASSFSNCVSTGTLTVNIPAPSVATPTMTIDITAVCPLTGTALNQVSSKAPPGTIVQFKQTGTSTWSNLGSVNNNGQLITSTLDITKSYDFQVFVANAGPNFLNGITKGWTGITLVAGAITTGQNGTGANQGTIKTSSVTFAPDNKSGNINIVYTVNGGWCK